MHTEAEPAADEPAFDWFRNWWPIALEADLDFERPNALQLLGKDIAVWRDVEGSWHAVHDLCPHRCVAGATRHCYGFVLTLFIAAKPDLLRLRAAMRYDGLYEWSLCKASTLLLYVNSYVCSSSVASLAPSRADCSAYRWSIQCCHVAAGLRR